MAGNFSTDPKKRSEEALENNYNGVLLQQGVPLLDADWNEMDGIRRLQLESLVRWVLGNDHDVLVPAGKPEEEDGFRIKNITFTNGSEFNVTVQQGWCLVNGGQLKNSVDLLVGSFH